MGKRGSERVSNKKVDADQSFYEKATIRTRTRSKLLKIRLEKTKKIPKILGSHSFFCL